MTSTGSTTKAGKREIYLCGDETIRFVEDLVINHTGRDMSLHRANLALQQAMTAIACAGSKVVLHSETNHPVDNHTLQKQVVDILDILKVTNVTGIDRDGWDPDFWIVVPPVHKRANYTYHRKYPTFNGDF